MWITAGKEAIKGRGMVKTRLIYMALGSALDWAGLSSWASGVGVEPTTMLWAFATVDLQNSSGRI